MTLKSSTLPLEGNIPSVKYEPISKEEIEKLIKQRVAARSVKNWAEADRIRDRLKASGIILEDDAVGTTWRREQH